MLFQKLLLFSFVQLLDHLLFFDGDLAQRVLHVVQVRRHLYVRERGVPLSQHAYYLLKCRFQRARRTRLRYCLTRLFPLPFGHQPVPLHLVGIELDQGPFHVLTFGICPCQFLQDPFVIHVLRDPHDERLHPGNITGEIGLSVHAR